MTLAWSEFISRQPEGHLLQTEEWAAFKSEFRWRHQNVRLIEESQTQAGAQILFRPLPSTRLPLISVAYVPKGPVVDWNDHDKVHRILQQVVRVARARRSIFVRIEPHLELESITDLEEILSREGFRPSKRTVQPRRSILVDISGSEEEILAQMKQKTRYNIRLAGRKGVCVRLGTREDLPAFSQMMTITGQRNQFGVHNADYYRAVFDRFHDCGSAGLLLAEYQGQPLAALMLFVHGKTAYYFYGASNNLERNRMPTYFLQWEAIRWARDKGCTLYDLWGIPDADEQTLEAEFRDRSDGLWGVYRFKRGFGGRSVRWVGAYDHVLNPVLYGLVEKIVGR